MTDTEKEVVLNKISAKLEQGWVLLQNPCPNCSYPLVKHKDQGTFCAKEGAFVISEEEAKAMSINMSALDAEADSLEAEMEDGGNKYGDLGDDFEDYYAKRLEHVDRASSAIGEHLLKGWTMLADACPTCGSPLMSLRDGPKTCVLCKSASPAPTKQGTKTATKQPPDYEEVVEQNHVVEHKRAPEKVEIRSEPVQMASFDKMLEEEEITRKNKEESERVERLRQTQVAAKPLVAENSPDLIPTLTLKLEFLREQIHLTNDVTSITNLAIAIKEVAHAIVACKELGNLR